MSVAALREGLGALAEHGSFSAAGLREARPDQISATVPHQVFSLTLEAARLGGDVTERVHENGWRFLLEVDGQVIASAETRSDEGGRHDFAQLNAGPFVAGTIEALAAAESATRGDDFESQLRWLTVPSVYLMSVWLVRADDSTDARNRFIPVAPAPRTFEPNVVYDEVDFASRLREAALAVPELAPEDERGG
jgi:hypothetical protein